MKLLELYALSTGLKINKPFIYKAFYPLPFQKYVTIQASSAQDAKCYSFWEDVVELIKPTLDKEGIQIVQLGGAEDESLKHCFHLHGKTNEQQTAYVLSNSILHISNDSFTAHVAGAFNIPLVEIFGSTSVENHSPYLYNKEKTTFIVADLKGHRPSFSKEESPKMVDTIMPETIANAILKSFETSIKRESLRIGEFYPTYIVELIPDHAISQQYLASGVINIRMDYHFDEKNFIRACYNRKCNVITNKPIDIKLLRAFKKNINRLSIQVFEDTDPEYIKELKSTGIDLHIFTKESDPDKISKLRLALFAFPIEHDKVIKKEDLDIKDKVGYNTHYKTNKFLISKDGTFLSYADWKAKRPTEGFENNVRPINDVPEFWEECEYFYLFNKD